MPREKCAIIAVGPHGFPGASQIMCQSLRAYSSAGHDVVYVGAEVPFLFRFLDPQGVRFSILPQVTGAVIREDGAIRSPDVLFIPKLAEAISTAALASCYGYSLRVIVWGHYLYPYGLAALLAAQQLKQNGRGLLVELWLTPTGSDVWEIGPQFQALTEWMLNSTLVTRLVTYTPAFADEIAHRYSVSNEIVALPPMLDMRRFEALDERAKGQARDILGIPQGAFVITSHSNMRPVKHPADVLSIAEAVARRVRRRVVLLLIGPKRDDLLPSQEMSHSVICTGILENVEKLLIAGDAELNCSSHDSFNLSLAEAMACGLVCVSTDVVGIASEIRSSGAGFLFAYEPEKQRGDRYESPISFLKRLCDDDAMRMELGARAKHWAKSRFSTETLMPRYLELLSGPGAQ